MKEKQKTRLIVGLYKIDVLHTDTSIKQYYHSIYERYAFTVKMKWPSLANATIHNMGRECTVRNELPSDERDRYSNNKNYNRLWSLTCNFVFYSIIFTPTWRLDLYFQCTLYEVNFLAFEWARKEKRRRERERVWWEIYAIFNLRVFHMRTVC